MTSPDAAPFNADPIMLDNFEGWRRFRKRPVIIHALQLNFPEGFLVRTLEGIMKGEAGDYLVIGTHGEKYPVKREIFEANYEKAE